MFQIAEQVMAGKLYEKCVIRSVNFVYCRFPNKHKNNRKVIRRKRNSICPVFRKKGTCAKLLKGECFCIHDRKYVALCQK